MKLDAGYCAGTAGTDRPTHLPRRARRPALRGGAGGGKMTAEELAKVPEEWLDSGKQAQELRSKRPVESEAHGWVWLYLRKAK
jgi:hypothetical protein